MTDVPYIYIYTYIYHNNNIFHAQLYHLCGARSGLPQLYVGWFLSMPSSGFQHFDANWQYFDVNSFDFFFVQADFWLPKYSHNAQLLILANLKIYDLHFCGFSILPSVLAGPK